MRRALVVWGGWEGHTPRAAVDVFIPWLGTQGFEVDVADTLDAYTDPERVRVDLVVPCWTMGQITGEQFAGLSAAVEAGTGLAGWHGGLLDAFRMNTEYQWMTGAQWVSHPGNCIPSYGVKVVDPDHEITKGIGDFTLKDTEQYYCHFDPANHVLCTTTFSGEHEPRGRYAPGTVLPYAYTKTWGGGRVFAACWGHTFKDFEVPGAKEIVQRGMLWAARG